MATPTDNAVALTGDPLVDGLVQGSAWRFGDGPRAITYSLSLNDNPNGGDWTASLSAAVRKAFDAWAAVANVTFTEVAGGTVYTSSTADIALILTGNELQQNTSGEAVSLGIFPSPAFSERLLTVAEWTRTRYPQPEGDITFDNYHAAYSYLNDGGAGLMYVLHEIGHALGLKHPFDDGGNGRPTFEALGIGSSDTVEYTVMSYDRPDGKVGSDTHLSGNAATPMPLDIFAIQKIYGANTTYHTGDDHYSLGAGLPSLKTIWDTGGVDTISVGAAGYVWRAKVDLRAEHISTLGDYQVAIARGVTIENATGGLSADVLTGNDAANRLDGGAGNDVLAGGAGDDVYVIEGAGDLVIESPEEGRHKVVSALTYTLPDNVEDLALQGSVRLDGTGNGLDNVLYGNVAANSLAGGAGNDTLEGGGGLDSMAGGAGDDVFIVADSGAGRPNTLALSAEPGSYYVNGGTASLALSAPPSAILLDHTGDGTVDYIHLWHLESETSFSLTLATNTLGRNLAPGTYADARRNAFLEAGHPGLDFSYGGLGPNEVYGRFTIEALRIDYSGAAPVLHSLAATFELHPELAGAPGVFGSFNYNYFGGGLAPETVIELPGEGIDEVRASVSFALPRNVENLGLTESYPIDGEGNALDNRIAGNVGVNALTGRGGADTLTGGNGADVFRYVTRTDSTLAAMDRIADIDVADRIDFVGMSGVSPSDSNYGYGASLAATIDAIRADTEIADAIVCFSDGTCEYLYVKGAGGGVDFGGTLIQIAGLTQPPVAATFQFSPGISVSVQAYSWKTHALLSAVAVTANDSTGGDGSAAHIAGITSGAVRLVPGLTVDFGATAAVNLQDAIAVLKMIVGLDINGANKPLSPYQAIAADFDANGSVNLTDAIGVLKHVVGLAAPAPAWLFVDEADATMAARAGLNPGTVEPTVSVDVTAATNVGLVGILRGDVDGSWTGPAGSPSLDVAHFHELVASHAELNLGQWGIY